MAGEGESLHAHYSKPRDDEDGKGFCADGGGLCVAGWVGCRRLDLVAADSKAIWSRRLRLFSGLWQRGRRLRRGWIVARLKPCPSGLVDVRGGMGGGLLRRYFFLD
jgi:hypothetical protein